MIPPSTTLTGEGRRLRRILLWAGAALVGLNLIVWLVSSFAAEGSTQGPDGSSFVTTPRGSAAIAGTLDRLGVPTARLRTPIDEAELRPSDTLAVVDVADGAYQPGEVAAIVDFVRDGGHLVVVGESTLVAALMDDPPRWRSAGAATASLEPPVGNGDLNVTLNGFGSLQPGPDDEPFLVAGDGTVVGTVRPVGAGNVLWVADSLPFQNRALAESAPAVVAMLDPAGTVYFDEYRHGYRESGGVWSVIPPQWRTALILGSLALVLSLIAYGRRFGPPYDTRRRLPPGREVYLEAVAGILQRSGQRATAAEVLRTEARSRLSNMSLPPEEAAEGMGLEPEEVTALFGEGSTPDDLVAADRALAKLSRQKG